MYDAEEILNLVKREWSIVPRVFGVGKGELIVNGDFEKDNLDDYETLYCSIDRDVKRSGLQSCLIGNSGGCEPEFGYLLKNIAEEVGYPVPVKDIRFCSVWVRAISGLQGPYGVIEVVYSDNSKTVIEVPEPEFEKWLHVDILPFLNRDKAVVSVKFYKTGIYGYDYVDDFSMHCEGELFLALDEFNPQAPLYQIVFFNRGASTIFVSPMVTKIEQTVDVEVHVKLVRYDPDTITKSRTIFKNIKDELNRIFTEFRYGSVGSVINMTGWVDSDLPHGFGVEKEPLEFVSKVTVEISEYKSLDESLIGVRVARINILGNDILGLTECTWEDTDPWVHIQIPKGPVLEQHLLGPHVHGEFTTHDWKSLYTALFLTTIPEREGRYPINADNSKTEFATSPAKDDFIIEMVDHKGSVSKFRFVNVKIKQLRLMKSVASGKEETLWNVRWMSDYYYPVL